MSQNRGHLGKKGSPQTEESNKQPTANSATVTIPSHFPSLWSLCRSHHAIRDAGVIICFPQKRNPRPEVLGRVLRMLWPAVRGQGLELCPPVDSDTGCGGARGQGQTLRTSQISSGLWRVNLEMSFKWTPCCFSQVVLLMHLREGGKGRLPSQ